MDDSKRLVRWMIGAGITIFVAVIAFYFYVFSDGHFPSQDSEDWARFGEFIGGTLGAAFGLLAFVGVILAISDGRKKAAEDRQQATEEAKISRSNIYFQQAEAALRTAVTDFLKTTDAEGRPNNNRGHWLNFARGVSTAQKLGQKIEDESLKDVWNGTEHYWRVRVHGVLDPAFESYPAEYYGYIKPEEQIKNYATSPGERMALSEPSLVFVYRWIVWPKNLPDELDKGLKFEDLELETMASLGPRGLATYIRVLHEGPPRSENSEKGSPARSRRRHHSGPARPSSENPAEGG